MRLPRLRRLYALMAVAAAGLAGWACYPLSPTPAEDRDLVSSFFDADFDFESQSTYAMPDEVFVVEGSDEDISDAFDDQILADIARNMAALGWIREMDPENNPPDVLLVPFKAQTTRTYIGWVPGWGWNPWFPGWGVWYPWPVVRQYTSGSVFVDMFYPAGLDGEQVPAVWSGAADGILSGSNPDLSSARIRRDIDQMFAQSPYLRAGQ